mgnify:FL=1|jgi:hypothetical protein
MKPHERLVLGTTILILVAVMALGDISPLLLYRPQHLLFDTTRLSRIRSAFLHYLLSRDLILGEIPYLNPIKSVV